jgi:hypothetical protein
MMIQLTKVMNAVPRRMKTLGSGFALGGLMPLAIDCEFANADIDPASIVPTSDVPATDALGTTLAPLTPVQ